MTKWEYRMVRTSFGEAEDDVNRLGGHGWQVVGMSAEAKSDTVIFCVGRPEDD